MAAISSRGLETRSNVNSSSFRPGSLNFLRNGWSGRLLIRPFICRWLMFWGSNLGVSPGVRSFVCGATMESGSGLIEERQREALTNRVAECPVDGGREATVGEHLHVAAGVDNEGVLLWWGRDRNPVCIEDFETAYIV